MRRAVVSAAAGHRRPQSRWLGSPSGGLGPSGQPSRWCGPATPTAASRATACTGRHLCWRATTRVTRGADLGRRPGTEVTGTYATHHVPTSVRALTVVAREVRIQFMCRIAFHAAHARGREEISNRSCHSDERTNVGQRKKLCRGACMQQSGWQPDRAPGRE